MTLPLAAGGVLSAACAAGGGDAVSGPSKAQAQLRVHVVKKLDVSDWVEAGLKQDIDGFKAKNPGISVTLELHGTWTPEYFPQVIAISASGQLGDLVWYPPRHRSHISWGTKYGIVRDLTPIAKAAKYDLNQFYKGATEQNTHEGKQYWLSYISEPIVPVIAYNKTRTQQLGLPAPKDDWTFDELADWARRGTTSAGSQVVWGYFRGDSGTGPFGAAPYLRQWGVEPVDKTGKKATFMDTREAFIQALTFRYNLTNTLRVSPNPKDGSIANHDWYGKEQRILAQDVWPFRIQGYPNDYKEFETDFVLTPTVKKGDRRRSMLNEHVFGITTASKSQAEAFTFLTWVSGKEMNVQGLLQGGKGPIARADVWSDARITDRWPTYKRLKPVMENVEADYTVANFRGEEFDTATSWARLERGEIPVLEMANEIQRLGQEVLNKEVP
ncbi:MAG TPA: extracellular solute-binding protein [Chloroflexota bacterium]|nr:extracellular solute-binding protein [Chloroflexota bacterium]